MTFSNTRKKVTLAIMAVFMVISSLLSFISSSQKVEADLDPASKLLCKFDDGKVLVNFYSTDTFHYMLRSKSAVTSTDYVESNWLNKMLEVTGFDFRKTNEAILGRELNPIELPEEDPSGANKKAPKVSAFDRFGMAGLKWSSYQGEWKFYQVDGCASQDKASPTEYGVFYKDRKDPKSTYDEISTSKDARSVQFNKGVLANIGTAFTDTISNLMFMITKIIITLTIMFVGLSFTDITTLLGMMESDGDAIGPVAGVFKTLFDGVFSGFVVMAFTLTAIFVFYKAVIKREVRYALSSLIKALIIFIMAFAMASNPSFWIGIPNKVANYGQALVLSTTTGIYKNDKNTDLCVTDVGSIDKDVNIDTKKLEGFEEDFEKINANMRSMIGCKMWEVLLFRPWVRGQYGAEYEDLAADKVKNDNSDWVGTPSVPVGEGKKIKNWALFQVSAQTNAHAPIGNEGIPTLVNGVNGDWWRITDALSNYMENESTEEDSNGNSQTYKEVIPTKPTQYWQSWIGNNQLERMGVAFMSVLFGVLGSLAPLVFGIASAVFGLGLTLLMMTSPIFLLFGLWSGKGDAIFLGWLSAVINTVLKKIGAGLLLVLSLSFSMIIMDMIDTVGYVTSFMLMLVLTLVLLRNKDKILNMIASINFGGAFDPRVKANQFFNVQKNIAREAGRTALATVSGAQSAKKSGQNVLTGARVGVTRQLENRMNTTGFGREILRQKEISEDADSLNRQVCKMCHMPLGVKGQEIAYEDADGNYYCVPCAEEMGIEELFEVVAGQKTSMNDVKSLVSMYKEGKGDNQYIPQKEVRSVQSPKRSWISHSTMRNEMDLKKVDGEYEWNDEAVQGVIKANIAKLKEDYVVYVNVASRIGTKRMNPPPVPEPLTNYIDFALINMAWEDNNFDIVEKTYKEAWKQWYEDNAEIVSNVNEEQIEKFKEEIDKYSFDVHESRAVELIEEYLNNETNSIDSEIIKDNQIYTFVNGKLVLNDKNIKKTDEILSD